MGGVLFWIRSGVLDCCFGSAIRLSHLQRNFDRDYFFVSLHKSYGLLHFHTVGSMDAGCGRNW